MMRGWTIELPDAEYLTPNSRAHWSTRKKCAARWREATAWLARAEPIPPLEQVRVQLSMVPKDRRRRDEDNLVLVQKWCVDGLVDASVIEDDAPGFVRAEMPRIRPADAGAAAHRWFLRIEELVEVDECVLCGVEIAGEHECGGPDAA